MVTVGEKEKEKKCSWLVREKKKLKKIALVSERKKKVWHEPLKIETPFP